MHDFSITGVPTVDYYDLPDEPESRIMFGSTAIYVSAVLARQGADVLFGGPIGEGLDHTLLQPLSDLGIRWELHELPGPVAWLRLVFAESGEVTFFEMHKGAGLKFDASQFSDEFWDARAFWMGTGTWEVKQVVAERGHSMGREVAMSSQGEYSGFGDELADLLPHLTYLCTNSAEASDYGYGELDESLHTLREINPDINLVITRGKNGAWLISGKDFYSIPAIPQKISVNLIGAGDSFSGTLIYSLMNGTPPPDALRRATAGAILKIRAFSYTYDWGVDDLNALTEQITPQLPVTRVDWDSQQARDWIEAEEPDTTQHTGLDAYREE